MSQQRRIPAEHSGTYASWTLPAVVEGVVVKAENARARRVAADEAAVESLHVQGFEQQLIENIKAGRYAQGVSARELEAIVRDAAQEGYRDGHAEGHAAGRQEGFAAGRADGLADGRRYIEEAASRFARLLEALQAPLAGQEEALREALLAVVAQIARAVVRAELAQQPGSIVRVVEEALAALPAGARNVRVSVSEADRALLEEFAAGEAAPAVVVDPALRPGDCRVVSAESLVDFTVSSRFAAIIEQFLAGSAGTGADA